MIEIIPKCFWLTLYRELRAKSDELKEMALKEDKVKKANSLDAFR